MKYSEFRKKIQGVPVFSTSMLGTLTDEVGTLKVQISHWKRRGLIRPLRRGLYLLNSEDRRVEPPLFYLANQIFIPSYVSLESALATYGLIPEFVAATTSVTARKTCRFENDFGLFTYQHVLPAGYGGFESVQVSKELSALVATPEKAVIDFLYLNLSSFSAQDHSIFLKSYRFQNGHGLQPKKLRAYAGQLQTKKLLAVVEGFIQEVVR